MLADHLDHARALAEELTAEAAGAAKRGWLVHPASGRQLTQRLCLAAGDLAGYCTNGPGWATTSPRRPLSSAPPAPSSTVGWCAATGTAEENQRAVRAAVAGVDAAALPVGTEIVEPPASATVRARQVRFIAPTGGYIGGDGTAAVRWAVELVRALFDAAL